MYLYIFDNDYIMLEKYKYSCLRRQKVRNHH